MIEVLSVGKEALARRAEINERFAAARAGVEGLTQLAPQIERVQLAILVGDYADSPQNRHATQ
jgi:hypothetical protein